MAVARKGEAPIAEIAKDFGISESCLRNWLHTADVEEGRPPGTTAVESAELRELKRRNRLLEQENERRRRAGAYLSQANLAEAAMCFANAQGGTVVVGNPGEGRGRRPSWALHWTRPEPSAWSTA